MTRSIASTCIPVSRPSPRAPAASSSSSFSFAPAFRSRSRCGAGGDRRGAIPVAAGGPPVRRPLGPETGAHRRNGRGRAAISAARRGRRGSGRHCSCSSSSPLSARSSTGWPTTPISPRSATPSIAATRWRARGAGRGGGRRRAAPRRLRARHVRSARDVRRRRPRPGAGGGSAPRRAERAVRRTAPGAFRAARPGAILYATDAWFDAWFIFVWPIALFLALGESFAAYGGAMALAALVGADAACCSDAPSISGRAGARSPSPIRWRRRSSLFRSASLGSPRLAVGANALGGFLAAPCRPSARRSTTSPRRRPVRSVSTWRPKAAGTSVASPHACLPPAFWLGVLRFR